jgi:hypothetical protein
VACLQREVSTREAHGREGRIRAARFPARKSLEEFDFDHARSLKRDTIAHLGTLDFGAARDNVVFLGPPGTGKTHLASSTCSLSHGGSQGFKSPHLHSPCPLVGGLAGGPAKPRPFQAVGPGSNCERPAGSHRLQAHG